jgi:hypothetical protein
MFMSIQYTLVCHYLLIGKIMAPDSLFNKIKRPNSLYGKPPFTPSCIVTFPTLLAIFPNSLVVYRLRFFHIAVSMCSKFYIDIVDNSNIKFVFLYPWNNLDFENIYDIAQYQLSKTNDTKIHNWIPQEMTHFTKTPIS